jgi:class 3 adenylate cyclase
MNADEDPKPIASTASDATFVFADIAGFTALTEAHGDEQAAALVAYFCDTVRADLPSGARASPGWQAAVRCW